MPMLSIKYNINLYSTLGSSALAVVRGVTRAKLIPHDPEGSDHLTVQARVPSEALQSWGVMQMAEYKYFNPVMRSWCFFLAGSGLMDSWRLRLSAQIFCH